MQLPETVRRLMEERAGQVAFPALKRAAAALSDAYRGGATAALHRLPPAERTAAYLVTRMPATYAAAYAVLAEVRRRLGDRPVTSILDLGAGTGAASLAARHWFPGADLAMIERDPAFAEAAQSFLPGARWIAADASTIDPLPPHDLVIAAYSLGEISRPVFPRLWQAARLALAVIEPGTPQGFAFIRAIRDTLLAAGAHMLAPCPMESACPVVAPDWCHFAARVERTSLHRRLKDARLNYEDEKFSYVALSREPAELPQERIVRHPLHQPGLIVLETCTPGGLRERRVTRREKEAFRAARHASWGDAQ